MVDVISNLKKGQRGIIDPVALSNIPLCLLEMGFLPGREVLMVQPAPLNDPLCVKINDTRIAIRANMAKKIKISKI